MTGENLLTLLQVIGPAVAVYAAIRSDLAVTKYRVTNLERMVFPSNQQSNQ
jgi:hypothetical protein